MKKPLLILVCMFIAFTSNAAPVVSKNATLVECFRHEEPKGVIYTQEPDWQLACFNKFKSTQDIPIEQSNHPTMVILQVDDLDPDCYNGNRYTFDEGGV